MVTSAPNVLPAQPVEPRGNPRQKAGVFAPKPRSPLLAVVQGMEGSGQRGLEIAQHGVDPLEAGQASNHVNI